MLTVDRNNQIALTRGDYAKIPLFINQGTDEKPMRYILQEGDAVYVGVMECNQPFEFAIIKKKYTNDNLNENGDVEIIFDHNDTKCLLPSKYFYTVKVVLKDEQPNTIIQNTQFIIEE